MSRLFTARLKSRFARFVVCALAYAVRPLRLSHRPSQCPSSALWLALGGVLFVALAGLAVTPARAAARMPATTYTVTKTEDTNDGVCDADCSLREAVRAANAAPGADTISLPAGVYNLTRIGANEDAAVTGDLDLTGSVDIVGAGSGSTIIDGQASDRVLHILTGATVTISRVNIRNGSLANYGAGILNEGTLTLNDSTVTGNQTAFGYSGGGIANRNVLTVNRSMISSNTSTYGAGIVNWTGNVTANVYTSTINSNAAVYDGGGVNVLGGTFAMTATVILGNSAGQSGGGISVDSGAAMTFTAGAILGNSVTSANNLRDVHGGGINNLGNITILDSTISGNSAYAHNTCSITGCSTSYQSYGGGISNSGAATFVNITLNHNSAWYRSSASGYTAGFGAGVYNSNSLALKNTILANSRGYLEAETGNCTGSTVPLTSLGHNLDSGSTCGLTDPTDKVSIDPLLGALRTYGNAPMVHPLLSGSPAIDAGANRANPTPDQRGFPRPFDGDGDGTATYDIGAFEFDTNVALASSANPSVVGQNVIFTATLSSSYGTPGGNITFKDGSTVLCTGVSLAGGHAICSWTSSGPGVHAISGAYSGDGTFSASTGTLSGGQTVNKAGTTTTLTAHLPTASDPGQSVTVNYTVVANAPGSATPSGNVTVSDGVDSCTASVAAGTCTLTLDTAGTRSLTATYAGDSNLLGSTSTPVSHLVNPPPHKLYIPMLVR